MKGMTPVMIDAGLAVLIDLGRLIEGSCCLIGCLFNNFIAP